MSRIEDPRTDVNHLAKRKLQLWNNGMADTLYMYPGIRESIACLFTSLGSIYARNGMLYTVLQYMYSTYKCVMLLLYPLVCIINCYLRNGAATAMDNMASSSRATKNFLSILLPILRTGTALPVRELSF